MKHLVQSPSLNHQTVNSAGVGQIGDEGQGSQAIFYVLEYCTDNHSASAGKPAEQIHFANLGEWLTRKDSSEECEEAPSRLKLVVGHEGLTGNLPYTEAYLRNFLVNSNILTKVLDLVRSPTDVTVTLCSRILVFKLKCMEDVSWVILSHDSSSKTTTAFVNLKPDTTTEDFLQMTTQKTLACYHSLVLPVIFMEEAIKSLDSRLDAVSSRVSKLEIPISLSRDPDSLSAVVKDMEKEVSSVIAVRRETVILKRQFKTISQAVDFLSEQSKLRTGLVCDQSSNTHIESRIAIQKSTLAYLNCFFDIDERLQAICELVSNLSPCGV
jgi:hypothetical protein